MGEIRESVILEVKAEGAVQTSQQLSAAFSALAASLAKIEDALTKTQKEARDLSVAEKEAAVAIDKATVSAEKNVVAVDRVDKSTDRAGRSVRQMVTGWRTAAQASQGFLSPMLRLSAVLGAGFGVQRAISDLSSFERGLTQIAVVSGATAKQLERIKQVSLDLGATTSKSASEALQGAVNLSKAGFQPDQVSEALPATLNLAVTAQLDLGRAAEITANTLAQFGLAASDAVKVSDALTVASQRSATDVAALADGMVYAGVVAGSFGVPLKDAAAAMAALAQGGLQGSIAGRGLAGVMSRLINPSKDAAAELERVDINIKDLDPRTAGLGASLRVLEIALRRGANVFKLFDQEMGKSALTLAKQADKFDEVTAAIDRSNNVAGEQAAAFGKDLQGSLTTLLSTLEAVTLKAGDRGLTGALRGLVNFATDTVRALGGIDQEGQRVSASASLAASAIEGLVAAASVGTIARFAAGLASLSNPISAVAVAVGAGVVALSQYRAGLESVAKGSIQASDDVRLFGATILEVQTRLANFTSGPLTLKDEILKQESLAQAARRVKNEIDKAGSIQGVSTKRFESLDALQAALDAAQKKIETTRTSLDALVKRQASTASAFDFGGTRGQLPAEISRTKGALADAEQALSNIRDARIVVAGQELIPAKLLDSISSASGRLSEVAEEQKGVLAGFVRFSFASQFLDSIATTAAEGAQALRDTKTAADEARDAIEKAGSSKANLDDLLTPLRAEAAAFDLRSRAVADAIAQGQDYEAALRRIDAAEEASVISKRLLADLTARGGDATDAQIAGIKAEADAYVAARTASEDYIASIEAQRAAKAKATQEAKRDADNSVRQLQADADRASALLTSLSLEAAGYARTRDEVERLSIEEDLRHLQVTEQTKDRIRAHLAEVQSLRQIREATDSIAGGATDALRALKEGGTGTDALQAGLQGVSDRLFQAAASRLEESISSALTGLFVDTTKDVLPTAGDSLIVAAVNQVTQAIYATAGAGTGGSAVTVGAGALAVGGSQFAGGTTDFGDPGFQGPPSSFNAQGAGSGGSNFGGLAAGFGASFLLNALAYSLRDKPKAEQADRGVGFSVQSGNYQDNRRVTIVAPKRDKSLERTTRQILADRNRA